MQQAMEMPKKVVRKIPAKIDIAEEIKQAHRQLRVAAYCRVSTAQEEQLNSYDVQVRRVNLLTLLYTKRSESSRNGPL